MLCVLPVAAAARSPRRQCRARPSAGCLSHRSSLLKSSVRIPGTDTFRLRHAIGKQTDGVPRPNRRLAPQRRPDHRQELPGDGFGQPSVDVAVVAVCCWIPLDAGLDAGLDLDLQVSIARLVELGQELVHEHRTSEPRTGNSSGADQGAGYLDRSAGEVSEE